MRKITGLLLMAVILITGYSCKRKTPAGKTTDFSFTVERANDFTGLPALQSFAFATTTIGDSTYWLMFGGRTNGFHGFGGQQDFPFKLANKFIYVYNTVSHKLDSMHTRLLPLALREQYTSTNMECRQVDSVLYVCGGYGEINAGKADSAWITHNIMSRIYIQKMVSAVLHKDSVGLRRSIAYDTNSIVASTGGELFQLPDGKFYLVLGHNFTGQYSSTNFVQKYLDSVHIFNLNQTDSTIQIAGPFQYLSDGKTDSFTQFRRRDLVVAPNVLSGGNGYGISIYAGVFTVETNPFRYPIYISGGNAPSYFLDSFKQKSNVYSAPNLQMYDSTTDQMYTTIFGGLGDSVLVNGDNASFVKLIMTMNRDNKKNSTRAIYNSSEMPHYVGAEGIFIRDANAPVYNNNNLDIIDYHKLKPGKQVVGYIYGGIFSDSTQWNNSDTGTINGHFYNNLKINRTKASDRVYKVWINKGK